MNDERIERALRQGPPDEPAYLPSGVRPSSAAPVGTATRRRPTVVRWASGGFQVATASIVAVALLAVIVLLRGQPGPQVAATPSPSNPTASLATDDLLALVKRNGFIRFALRPDFPQAAISGLEGFDVDVANGLAGRLGLTTHPVQLAADQMLGSGGVDAWDVGLPSALVSTDAATRLATTDAYYYWPVYLVVSRAATASSATDLGGQRICVTAASSGAAWLGGHLDPSSGMAAPPPAPPAPPVVRTEATDWACLDALTSGAVDALVTSTVSDSDLAARPSLRTVGGPLYIEPRTMVAARAGLDPSALLTAVDDALGAMRLDGTLADLSRNRFGGRDLTIPPSP